MKLKKLFWTSLALVAVAHTAIAGEVSVPVMEMDELVIATQSAPGIGLAEIFILLLLVAALAVDHTNVFVQG